jgi:transposase, IS5 family
VKTLPGNPYDGHVPATVIPDMEALVGNTIARILTDKGYRGHNAPPDYKFRVFISGQKQGVTPAIKRQLRHTISGTVGAMLPTPSSPPSATTSAA